VICHWDEIEGVRKERGHIAGTWQSLTGDRSVTVGLQRIRIDPGRWSTPLHLENSEEEIFFVLAGSGISLQWDGSATEAFDVGAGDCLVHLASEYAHTLRAGPEGLDVLAFGERHYPVGSAYLPRAGVSWGLGAWARVGDPEDHPWKREAEAGEPEIPDRSRRPARIVNVAAVQAFERIGGTVGRRGRDLGSATGSLRTGLTLFDVLPGLLLNPPHVHSAEEEIFVVLEGDGSATLWPHTRSALDPERFEAGTEHHALRAGHTIAQPAGTGRPLALQAGESGMRVLAYGTREPNDITYYPRSGKFGLRGVGVLGRVEQLDYWDGED
jgi:uncharacterized cupin superfamily protein